MLSEAEASWQGTYKPFNEAAKMLRLGFAQHDE